jgi:anaerobic selenocysteine-containing dehydrogenase
MSVDLQNGVEPRQLTCLKKNADGGFQPIDKLQATTEIADRLSEILEKHGPRSLAIFFGSTSYFDSVGKPLARSLMSTLGSPNIFSSFTLDQSSKWVAAARMGVFAGGIPSLDLTDVVLLCGTNPLVSHQGFPFSPVPAQNAYVHITSAKKRGVKFIVIDPRKTEMARIADLYIQPFPNQDAGIYAAIIRLILVNGWENKAFCARWTHNIEILRKAVEPFNPDFVARVAGIPAEQLHSAAGLLRNARKPNVSSGTGPNMAAFSNTAEHLCAALNAILGGYVTAGDKIPNPGIYSPRSPVEAVFPPNRTWEHEPKCHSADYGKLMGEFPASILPDEILTPGPHKIRALIVVGANPALSLSEPARVHEAFKDLDLMVTFDPSISATAQFCHYVLSPPMQFERADVTAFTDISFPYPFAQYTEAVVPPPAGTLAEYEFFWHLARKLGIQLILKSIPFGTEYKDVKVGLNLDMNTLPPREDLVGWLADQGTVRFETLRRHPHGYIEVSTATLKPAEIDDGSRLHLCPDDVFAEIEAYSRQCDSVESGRQFLLSSRRIVESFNSSFQQNPITLRRHRTNRLYVHPDDLRILELTEDDGVQIDSANGSIIGYVRSDATMKPGVVSMAHGWGAGSVSDPWGLKGAHTGRLVSMHASLQPINRMPQQSGIPVSLSKLPMTLTLAH